ncbi:Rab family GTPase [Pyrobaculum neutrophilum]|uniref:Miro domain protein n=1 Tax=Pyrobaculum neutrophilum (strain DSM 2338 / JCM 9278 / NBRC 100436 / V24Sta) TaxID=444157 RepID=B1YCQ8_PYRNV|nr:GTPase domain-containing protein [Pyrobaculum neutrophilum]ACB39571.1 Miro domain protein [Pyrobaculum neutrophilum V24Sta]
MRCLLAVVLGVGGVGKTTYIYRLVGVPVQPKTTLRPGIYRWSLEGIPLCIVDIPGDKALEVADALARAWPFYFDLAVFMYDVTDVNTLHALLEINSHLRGRLVKPYRRSVVVGNKVDLAGPLVRGEEVARAVEAVGVFYISALRDSYDKVVEPIRAGLRELNLKVSR